MNEHFHAIIVGSGAAGATLARELSKAGLDILIVEQGPFPKRLGTFQDVFSFYDRKKITDHPIISKEGVVIYRTLMAGGSTVVSCGNAVRCLEVEFKKLGINLDHEFIEIEDEMKVGPLDQALLSKASRRIKSAAGQLGYSMQPMPKFINHQRCKMCASCPFGCLHKAKWTALDYLSEAQKNGATIIYNTCVQQVMTDQTRATGIVGLRGEERIMYTADIVILSAGGLGTPRILQASGINDAGSGLFVDLFVNTYGVIEEVNQLHDPPMTLVCHDFYDAKGFVLSPFMSPHDLSFILEVGPKSYTLLPRNRLMGIMTKIADESSGCVFSDGTFSKAVTQQDSAKLEEGSLIAADILVEAGAERSSIVVSRVQGAHPGGTAAIGRIVNEELETSIANLYVCDASVLPKAPGLPPILTIVALAKWLARRLV
jgi:choline dehydrogenase-like flavoprotein